MITIAPPDPQSEGYLDGKMLIAMPSMTDPRFARTLIYLCAHSAEGAMGIVVNKPAVDISFSGLLDQLDIVCDITADDERLLAWLAAREDGVPVSVIASEWGVTTNTVIGAVYRIRKEIGDE